MLKLEDIGKKLKSDLIFLIVESVLISFLGALFGFCFLSGIQFYIAFLIPVAACVNTFLLEKEMFKYWNNEKDMIFTFHLSIISSFISSILFTVCFFKVNLILNIALIILTFIISDCLFYNYYKGYVECLAHQMMINNKNTKNNDKGNEK
jgi:hypothetical protein